MAAIEIAQKTRYDILNRYLLDEFVLVHLDPRQPGVVVPSQFANQDMLTLKLSKLFRGPMEVTREWVQAELLFDQEYFNCTVPLASIWGMTSYQDKTFVWPENAPKSILGEAVTLNPQEKEKQPTPKIASSKRPSAARRGHLTRVK